MLILSTMVAATQTVSASQNSNGHNNQFAEQFSNRLSQASWIRMKGDVSQWGSTEVSGVLHVQARTRTHQTLDSNKVSSVTVLWTTNTSRPIDTYKAKENFTYTFYTAKLTNASLSTLNLDTSTNSHFLNGTWTLSTISSTITINTDENGNIIHVNRNQAISPTSAYGELSINGNQYTLTIDGIDKLSGTVYHSIIRSWHNPFKMSDDSNSTKVTPIDVKIIGRYHGAMPGWGNYDSNMDFNNNYRIDIADISTVAAKI